MTVVILIIAVLVALSFTGINAAQNAARKAQVKNELGQIITAVKGYYSDYGSYPLNPGVNTVYGNPSPPSPTQLYSSADLFDILRAIPDSNFNQNNQLNQKGLFISTVRMQGARRHHAAELRQPTRRLPMAAPSKRVRLSTPGAASTSRGSMPTMTTT